MNHPLLAACLIAFLGLGLWSGCAQQPASDPAPAHAPTGGSTPATAAPPAGSEKDFSDSFESGTTEPWQEGSDEEDVEEPPPPGTDTMTTKTLDPADER